MAVRVHVLPLLCNSTLTWLLCVQEYVRVEVHNSTYYKIELFNACIKKHIILKRYVICKHLLTVSHLYFLVYVWLCRVYPIFMCPCVTTMYWLICIPLQDHTTADWAGRYRVERETSRNSPSTSFSSAAPQRGTTQRRGPPGSSREGGQGCRSFFFKSHNSVIILSSLST